jgi:glucose/arabinose dehydrogenase/PKD repeat protein
LRTPGKSTRSRRPLAAFVVAVLATGILPGHAEDVVLAADPPALECHGELFAEPAASGSSCRSSSAASESTILALPSGFTETIVFSGLTNPTNVEFAADGRIFIAEKSGVIKVYDNLNDTTPTSFAVLPPSVHNYWDRGLLGMALDPSLTNPALPSRPWVYVLYTYDHQLGSSSALPWGDTCPSPPGPTTDGCVVSGRLSRFTVSGNTIANQETVLIEDWCQQFPSHSVGNLAFGPDGALYVSAGDGASFNAVDYGQFGGTVGTPPPTPVNPCADPALEGGALRSQDLRTEPTADGGNYVDAVLPDAPIGYWRLGETSGTTAADSSGNGRNGTFQTGYTLGATSLTIGTNPAVTFSGGSVLLPANVNPWSGDFTIEAWAKPANSSSYAAVFQREVYNANGFRFGQQANRWAFWTSESGGNILLANNPGTLAAGQTDHIVVTRSGSTFRLYVNGIEVGNSGGTYVAPTGGGAIGAVGGGPFSGVIDEVAVYGTALSASRILAHYNAGTPSGGAAEPVTLDGAILRVDPVTGAAFAGNPYASSPDLNKRRIIAYGMRNPFRFDVRPGTNELWVGDVGWNLSEEINRIANISDGVVEDFGWPCYEGSGRQSGYDAANLPICEEMYQLGNVVTTPTHAYAHSASVVAGDGCPVGGSAISGIEFYPESGGSFPAAYRGGLFFADYTRNCIWSMAKGTSGQPDPQTLAPFVAPAAGPVDLEVGPDGALYYVDFGGSIRRVQFSAGNQPPNAVAQAAPTSGPAPLNVSFDGRSSSDPEAGTLTYAWDLDGDGAFDDSTSATPTWTYTAPATVTVRLRVTDPGGLTDTDTVVVSASNTPPVPVINTPASGTTWEVGEKIDFSGSATDAQDGTEPATRLSWQLVIRHCPSTCHSHVAETFSGVASGSFFGPDHEYPAHLDLTLTATDAQGASSSVTLQLDPKTVILSFATNPTGLQLAVNSATATAPFTREVIKGSLNTVSASSPQAIGSTTYSFTGWSDGGAASHTITANQAASYTATYAPAGTLTTLAPVADAEIRSNKPTKNFGTLPTLTVRSGSHRSYLRFDVPSLSGTLAAARLRLFVVEGSTAGGSAFTVGNNWTETGITWNNAPPISGTALGTAGAAVVGAWVEFDVKAAIVSGTPVTFALSGGNSNSVDYSSRTGTQAPQLVITTGP